MCARARVCACACACACACVFVCVCVCVPLSQPSSRYLNDPLRDVHVPEINVLRNV